MEPDGAVQKPRRRSRPAPEATILPYSGDSRRYCGQERLRGPRIPATVTGIRVTGIRIILAFGLLSLALAGAARADGCYIPERAITNLPRIPAQRALVSFRDGRETLLVESQLEGQGRRFGWVIPVPARPDAIEAASPGALKSLAMGIQPKIVHDLREARGKTVAVCLCLLAICLVWCVVRRLTASGKHPRLWPVLLTVLTALVIAGLVMPTTLAARRGSLAASVSGVSVLQEGRVGSYDVTVLAAEDAEALYKWLDAEDLAIPAELKPVAADYVAEGWRFVTAKLVTDGDGDALPHPLRISFPAERAVYPMRLTALAGSPYVGGGLALELYVVGERAAAAPGMKRVFCDRLVKREHWGDYGDPVHRIHSLWGRTPIALFEAESSRLGLGHPGLLSALWDGCWISKLTGEIPPSAMGEDFYISWQKPRHERQKRYSPEGAGHVGYMAAAVALAVAAALVLVLWARRRIGGRTLCLGLLASVGAATVIFWTLQLCLPQVEVSAYGRWGGRVDLWRLQDKLYQIEGTVHEGRLPVAEAEKRLRAALAGQSNPYTGAPTREEDSPGNYTLAAKDGKLVFTLYDLGGAPVTVEIGEREEGR